MSLYQFIKPIDPDDKYEFNIHLYEKADNTPKCGNENLDLDNLEEYDEITGRLTLDDAFIHITKLDSRRKRKQYCGKCMGFFFGDSDA